MPLRAAPSLGLIRQLVSFGAVGACATLAHVALAWVLIDRAQLNPYLANLLGTCAAFAVSFFGNAGLTFRTDRLLVDCAQRYVFVSATSFLMTSGILAVVEMNALPTYVYVIVVLGTVPPATFLLAKLWAFKPLPDQSGPS
ncbi:MAG: GtrA family protein [Novosphingobium sp.]|jgi:putative flippase GtrA|nr:GtrA family protein [Novosphingobium sp.]